MKHHTSNALIEGVNVCPEFLKARARKKSNKWIVDEVSKINLEKSIERGLTVTVVVGSGNIFVNDKNLDHVG